MKKIIEAVSEAPAAEVRKFFDNSDELCEYMSDLCGGVSFLAFSRGKDSAAAWLKMRRYFKKIVPVFFYSIPGGLLSFEEKSLKYFEDFFETRIYRIPHPSMNRLLNYGVFQAPENCAIIDNLRLPKIEYEGVYRMFRDIEPQYKDVYCADGVRSADSIMRHTAMKKYGAVNHNDMKFHAVYDYKKADIVKELEAAQISLPIDYLWFGRTFDGIDSRFIAPLKENSPADYERVKKAFPLVELNLLRDKWRMEYYHEGAAT